MLQDADGITKLICKLDTQHHLDYTLFQARGYVLSYIVVDAASQSASHLRLSKYESL